MFFPISDLYPCASSLLYTSPLLYLAYFQSLFRSPRHFVRPPRLGYGVLTSTLFRLISFLILEVSFEVPFRLSHEERDNFCQFTTLFPIPSRMCSTYQCSGNTHLKSGQINYVVPLSKELKRKTIESCLARVAPKSSHRQKQNESLSGGPGPPWQLTLTIMNGVSKPKDRPPYFQPICKHQF